MLPKISVIILTMVMKEVPYAMVQLIARAVSVGVETADVLVHEVLQITRGSHELSGPQRRRRVE
jgi:hypothetical protein